MKNLLDVVTRINKHVNDSGISFMRVSLSYNDRLDWKLWFGDEEIDVDCRYDLDYAHNLNLVYHITLSQVDKIINDIKHSLQSSTESKTDTNTIRKHCKGAGKVWNTGTDLEGDIWDAVYYFTREI